MIKINEMKIFIKQNYILSRIIYKMDLLLRGKKEFKQDYDFFKNNYIRKIKTQEQIEYNLMILVHLIEKGMCYKKLRPYGKDKVREIIYLYNLSIKKKYKLDATPYKMAINILYEWKSIYEKENWEKTDEYRMVNKFLREHEYYDNIIVGKCEVTEKELSKYKNNSYLDAIKTRHATRVFSEKKLNDVDIEYCIKAALATPTACNRQMVKIYFINDLKKRNILIENIKGLHGFDIKNINLFIITYDESSLLSSAERNQGYFNSGLVATNFCNSLHFKGIGSCFLQWANSYKEEKIVKKALGISNCEKISVILGTGYYKNIFVTPCSHRKTIEEIYKKI